MQYWSRPEQPALPQGPERPDSEDPQAMLFDNGDGMGTGIDIGPGVDGGADVGLGIDVADTSDNPKRTGTGSDDPKVLVPENGILKLSEPAMAAAVMN